ncbi:hypothetical protein IE53DRAFT_387946 [Violaceomyces palustris]|uniref:Uncharacterized protein n=1 Tax=Violaceomyces palustris TaxID=1673888 RepID=A0ACD0NVF2_9BASI|nr:hypothetical protein IE53DRAFT_387946 [Violaceomyces palustris]
MSPSTTSESLDDQALEAVIEREARDEGGGEERIGTSRKKKKRSGGDEDDDGGFPHRWLQRPLFIPLPPFTPPTEIPLQESHLFLPFSPSRTRPPRMYSSTSIVSLRAAASLGSTRLSLIAFPTSFFRGYSSNPSTVATKAAFKVADEVSDSISKNVSRSLGEASKLPTPTVVGSPLPKRSKGGIRGGLMGFLLGFGLASAYGYYYLLQEYNSASRLMLTSVEELQSSTEKITAHLQRLTKLEADLKALSASSVTRSEVEKTQSETKKIYDGIYDEIASIKRKVLGAPRPTKYLD